MNRLIIIGNGFDLAHGMKTSYKDFILWFLYRAYSEAQSSGLYDDELIYFKIDTMETRTVFNEKDNLEKYQKYILEIPNDEYQNLKSGVLPSSLIFKFIINRQQPYFPLAIVIKNPFINKIINQCINYNWVDIENEYYLYLKQCLFDTKKDIWSISVAELNVAFEAVKKLLEKYLSSIKIPKPVREIDNVFREPFSHSKKQLINNPKLNIINSHPEQYFFLNFNYTNLLDEYFKYYTWQNISTHIQIHGNILNKSNPIIFGYGDEMDEGFKNIEDIGIKENSKYFKSYWYSITSNYRKIFRLLSIDKFDVQLLGHSCGLSDRVLLNAIFEHPNCNEIGIHYYQKVDGTNDYQDIYHNVSRCFELKNRNNFRKTIASFEESDPFPNF